MQWEEGVHEDMEGVWVWKRNRTDYPWSSDCGMQWEEGVHEDMEGVCQCGKVIDLVKGG